MDMLAWLEGSPIAVFLRQAMPAYILVNAAHILGIGLLLGAILPLDLRIIGLLRSGRIAELTPFLVRVAATGLLLAIVTGLLLFSVKPTEYAGNPALLAKLGLLALGLANIAVLHSRKAWSNLLDGGRPGAGLRILAALSFTTWLAALVAGRWIGFL